MSRFLNVLRSWLVMVSIIAMGNTLQSFRDHTFLYEKLYTGKPDLVNGLQARTFGIWTLLSSVIRCLCAIDIHNKTYAKILNNQPTLQERLKASQRSLLLMPHSGPSLCGIPRIHLPGGRGLQSQAVPHHTLDLPPRPGPLPLRAVCLWDRSSHDWRPGTPDGGNSELLTDNGPRMPQTQCNFQERDAQKADSSMSRSQYGVNAPGKGEVAVGRTDQKRSGSTTADAKSVDSGQGRMVQS
uniref:ergosterol biosynthetic protein 28 homolog isoform X1 n=1 Tax=Panthera onca TaxID=9690 RepID=UPI002953C567|nr:ergosterol biosynthetic protein 28 homolog isoform X1 [Panthera onca]